MKDFESKNETWAVRLKSEFNPHEQNCSSHDTCMSIDMNLVCKFASWQNWNSQIATCQCRSLMKWNKEYLECQLFIDVNCTDFHSRQV